MKNKKKYLLILPLPPPFGGGEIRAQIIKENFKDNENYFLHSIERKRTSKKTQGKFLFINFYYAIILIMKVYYEIIKYRPEKLFTGLPKEFPAFLRTSFIILFARLFRIKVYGELAGTSFPFIEKKLYFINKYSCFIFKNVYSARFLAENIKNNYSHLQCEQKVVFDNGIILPVNYSVNRKIIFDTPLKMIYVGSLEYYKGIITIINALKLCEENEINFEFNFLGEWANEKEKNQIEDLIKENNLSGRIHFHGLKTNNDKWNIFTDNALLIHPTYWDGQPITILEAMGLGLGIISTKVGAIPETVIDGINGIILEENTPYNLFFAIQKFYNDRNYLEQISENNKKTFLEKFTIEKFLKNYRNWIEN